MRCAPSEDDTIGDLKKLLAAQIGASLRTTIPRSPHSPRTSSTTPAGTVLVGACDVGALSGTRAEKLRIQKWYTIYKDHITLEDYEIHDGMGLELYYN